MPGLGGEEFVVGGPELAVGAGAADFHAGGAFGVEEKRCAPAVAEFAVGVEGGVIARDEGEAEAVLAGEGGGDVGVGADRVAVAREVAAEGVDDLEDEAQVGADVAGGGVEGVGEGGPRSGRRERRDLRSGR